MAKHEQKPKGGNGGSVQIIGGTGTAIGGNGGRGGAPGYGAGGHGGGGTLVGNGYIRGGDGGDAGRPARPALGAASAICYLPDTSLLLSIPGICDSYGIPQYGRGGDSHEEYINHDEYKYSLNILLQLIRGPIPKLIDNPEIIDIIDELSIQLRINTGQEWWGLAVEKFPIETGIVMTHMRACEAGREQKLPGFE